MKTHATRTGVRGPAAATVALALVAAAAAGQEAPPATGQAAEQGEPVRQDLAFRTGYRTSGGAGPTWGQVMELSPQAPRGVELPEFRGKPAFALWKVGVGKLTGQAGRDGGLWAALDNSTDAGPWDTLYLDTNANGSLADEKPVRATLSRLKDGASHAVFDMVQLFLPAPDGVIRYDAKFQCTRVPPWPTPLLHAIAFCWNEGKVNIGGADYVCTLLDNNGDARFGQYHPVSTECDRIVLEPTSGRRGDSRDNRFDGYVGKYVLLRGKYYRVDIAPNGSWAAFTHVEPEMGVIQGSKGVELLAVKGTGGQFSAPENGPFRVPAGEKYMALEYRARKVDENGDTWEASDYGCGKEVPYLVRAEETTVIGAGRTFMWLVRCTQQEPGVYRLTRSVRSIRGDGVDIRCFADGDRELPRMRITSADRSYNNQTFFMEAGNGGGSSLVWRAPADVKGPFTAVCDRQSPFETVVRPAVIGGPRTDIDPPEPPDPNSPECRKARKEIAAIEAALAVFQKDLGRCPTTDEGLEALLARPEGLEGWRGPYVKRLPTDPWGHAYLYYCPAQDGRDGFDVLSVGPDCQEGTADDIANRPLLKPPRGTYRPPPLIPATTLFEQEQEQP